MNSLPKVISDIDNLILYYAYIHIDDKLRFFDILINSLNKGGSRIQYISLLTFYSQYHVFLTTEEVMIMRLALSEKSSIENMDSRDAKYNY